MGEIIRPSPDIWKQGAKAKGKEPVDAAEPPPEIEIEAGITERLKELQTKREECEAEIRRLLQSLINKLEDAQEISEAMGATYDEDLVLDFLGEIEAQLQIQEKLRNALELEFRNLRRTHVAVRGRRRAAKAG